MTLDEIKKEAYDLYMTSKSVWTEDECTRHLPGHMTLGMAIKQHTGKDYLEAELQVDYGDHFVKFCEGGWIEVIAFDCDSLHKLETI